MTGEDDQSHQSEHFSTLCNKQEEDHRGKFQWKRRASTFDAGWPVCQQNWCLSMIVLGPWSIASDGLRITL